VPQPGSPDVQRRHAPESPDRVAPTSPSYTPHQGPTDAPLEEEDYQDVGLAGELISGDESDEEGTNMFDEGDDDADEAGGDY